MSADTTCPSPLEITFIMLVFDPEPGVQYGLPLAKWMVGRGHKVKVLTTFPNYPLGKIFPGYKQRLWQWETMEGVRVLRVPIFPSHDLSARRRMATYFSFMASTATLGVSLTGQSDLVFLYNPPPTNGVASLLLKHLRGIPVVQHIGDMWPDTVVESGMIKSPAVRNVVETVVGSFCKHLYSESEYISVLSPGFKRLLMERGVPEHKVRVIYNWADESLFRPIEKDRRLAAELGLSDRFTLMYAGNMGPIQNIQSLVRAAAQLKDREDLQVVLLGSGPMESDVRRLAIELQAKNVSFLPRQPYSEMARVHALADVLMVHLRDKPFLRATIPSKTQVAMACGRPILMGVRGDAADLVTRAECGIACEPDNVDAIAQAMVRFSRMSQDQLRTLGANGRRYYEQNLSFEASVREMERMFLDGARARTKGRART